MLKRGIEVLRDEGYIAFIKRFLRFVWRRLPHYIWICKRLLLLIIMPYAIYRIKNLGYRSLDKAVDFAFTSLHGLIRPAQFRCEILELLKILDGTKPRTILEIGTIEGGTLFLFSRIVSKDATLISVDLPPAQFLFRLRAPLYKSFASKGQQLYLIRKDSHSRETLEEVGAILKGRRIDFLFIDGDHTYEGVKKDFEMYGPLVSENGIIAFHDILDSEIDRFWHEIKLKSEHMEIVKDWNQNWCGIGLIKKAKI